MPLCGRVRHHFGLRNRSGSCRPRSSAAPSPSILSPSSRQRRPIESRVYSTSSPASRVPNAIVPPARPKPITLAADKAYDAGEFVHELRSMNATPHVAQNTHHRSLAVDGRTARHAGYAPSQSIRKRIKEAFGWIKTIAGQEPTKFRGQERVGWAFTFAAAAYSLARLPKLVEAA